MKTPKPLPAPLVKAQRQFEDWRQTRPYRTAIPDKLWALAVKLATRHGTSCTARALRVNATKLKARIDSQQKTISPSPEPPSFLELSPSFLQLKDEKSDAEGVIELEDPTGFRMRIQWRGPQAPTDVMGLCRNFFGGES